MLGLAAGCAPKAGPEESPAPETSSPVAETPPAETVAPYQTIRLGLLNGPTGMGAAKLLADSDAGETVNHYEYAIGSDPSTDIVPKLNNGELDIAAVPTNLAATLYNKAGSIRLLALNTLGVLHILENGDTVHSMADLAGKTIYSINQGTNTEYVLNYLLEESGLTPGEDVTIEWKTSEEVTALMASGGIDLCHAPCPRRHQRHDRRTPMCGTPSISTTCGRTWGRRHLYHGLRGGPERLRGGAPGGGGRLPSPSTPPPSPM